MGYIIKALPSQARFYALDCRFKGFSGPVGSGKTLALCTEALRKGYQNAGRVGLLGAPTYPMLRDATLRTMFERLDEYKVPFDYLKQENVLTLKEPGSKILCRAVENFDRLRGTNLAWFALDETSYCPEGAWLQLEARLRDPLATHRSGFGAWTPKGWDWIYRKFIKQEKPNPNYQAVLANPAENTYLPADFYANLAASYNANFHKQEVLGEYLNIFSGRVYYAFESGDAPGGNVAPKKEKPGTASEIQPSWCFYDPARPVLWSLDFNINPAASVIAQAVPRNQRDRVPLSQVSGSEVQLNVLDELYLPDSNTYQVCEAFYERTKKHRERLRGGRLPVYLYGDATGDNRSSAASRTNWQIVKDFFARYAREFDASFRVKSENPLVVDRVNCVNNLLCSSTGQRRLMVHWRCKELIRDLEEVGWALDANGAALAVESQKDKARTHLAAALGYLVEREFGMRAQSGLRKAHIH